MSSQRDRHHGGTMHSNFTSDLMTSCDVFHNIHRATSSQKALTSWCTPSIPIWSFFFSTSGERETFYSHVLVAHHVPDGSNCCNNIIYGRLQHDVHTSHVSVVWSFPERGGLNCKEPVTPAMSSNPRSMSRWSSTRSASLRCELSRLIMAAHMCTPQGMGQFW